MLFKFEPHPCELDESKLLEQCQLHFVRRGGPGGQHRNKVSSGVTITHLPTGITAEGNERRDQHQNRKVALGRLRLQLAWLVRRCPPLDHPPESQASPAPSQLWRQRCIERPADVSPEHWDFPTLISEALDCLYQSNWEIRNASPRLEVSTARLAKLLRKDAATLDFVNRCRTRAGLGTLR